MRSSGCQANIWLSLSDTLVGESLGHYNRGSKWTETIENLNPDIAIISAGAHITNRTGFDYMLESVIKDVQRMQKTRPELKVIWKTQQPGGCFEDPLTDLPREQFWQQYPTQMHNYNQYLERDEIAKTRFREEAKVPVIDLEMLYRRTDGHPGSKSGASDDCLHLCMPGPLDIFPTLLHHVFLEYYI